MKYLLDTNICIDIINRKPSEVIKRIESTQPEEVAVSTITIAELDYGVAGSRYPARNRIALLEFLTPFMILDFDGHAATHYGLIRTSLRSKGTPIGPMDLLLAAQAKAHNLILVTNNEKEFQRVDGLQIENWMN